MERYTNGYADGFSDGFKDKPVIPSRKVKHLFYMAGAYMTMVAAVSYPRVTIIVCTGAWLVGVLWWFYPLLRAQFTPPVEVVKEKPVRTPNPKIQDQREAGQVVSLSDDETKRLGIDPDITHLIPKVRREEAS